MDRRTFVLLTGATSGALIRPPVRPTHSPTGAGWRSGGPAVGRLRFELDDHRRWSLWYYGDGSPVPVVRGAEIVAWVGDQPLTLAELEDSTVGNRRPPGGDGLEALRALFVPSSPVDQERLAQAVAPAGWCTRAEWSGTVAEADVITNLDFSAAHFDRRFFRHIELDDGYQQAIGAWDPNPRFPHGHAWLTDQIHARGFKAGLWVAPFGVAEASGVPTASCENGATTTCASTGCAGRPSAQRTTAA